MTRNLPQAQIFFLAFILSFNAFLAEANCMQMISASLGGTLLQYQLGVGLFIFSLGMGSLFYPFVSGLFSNRTILLFSSISLSLVAWSSPHLSFLLDQSLSVTVDHPLAMVYYIPIVVIGMITGLDLPTLIFTAKDSESKILGLDYLGMFIACITFPFIFFNFGIFKINLLNFGIGLGSFLLCFLIPKKNEDQSSNLSLKRVLPLGVLFTCFLLSICSLCYELLLARLLADFISDEVRAMTFSIGFYLLGLAIGSFTFKKKNVANQLLKTELTLIISMLLAPFVFLTIATTWQIYLSMFFTKDQMVMAILSLITWVGFWSGRELPILLAIPNRKKESAYSQLFFVNYIGALIGTLALSLWAIPSLGVHGSIVLVVCLNILSLIPIILSFPPLLRKSLIVMAIAAVIISIIPKSLHKAEQIYLKSIYHNMILVSFNSDAIKSLLKVAEGLDDILRITTRYQNIDISRAQLPFGGEFGTLTLYLNQQPQFSTDRIDLYHDSFSLGALNLANKYPKEVLILGGGDGFLAQRLVKEPKIEKVTLIELDVEMIKLAKTHPTLQDLNGKVFDNKKLTIINDDAFSWLKKNNIKYDGIFIDFPYPINYELGRLYSIEFYKLVVEHLKKDGFMVMDAPLSFDINASQFEVDQGSRILTSTLSQAGFQSILAYGNVEPFVFATPHVQNIRFHYDKMKDKIIDLSFVNLTPILNDIQTDGPVNSLYKPEKVVTW